MVFYREYAGVTKPHIFFSKQFKRWVFKFNPPPDEFIILDGANYASNFCLRLNLKLKGKL